MSDYFDRYETRPPKARESAFFRDLRAVLKISRARASALRGQLKGVDIDAIKSRAELAKIPVVRKSDLKAMQGDNPPFGGLGRRARHAAQAHSRFARPHLRAGGFRQGLVGRRARAACGGPAQGRSAAERLFLSSDAGRPHHGERRACAVLHRHSCRRRQYRAAARGDPVSQADRLLRHAGFSQTASRQGARGRHRRLLDQARARVGRRIAQQPARGTREGRRRDASSATPPPISA